MLLNPADEAQILQDLRIQKAASASCTKRVSESQQLPYGQDLESHWKLYEQI
jgi:hypothetical protein